MEKRPILAIMYDFDHTLSPRDMRNTASFQDLGMEADSVLAQVRHGHEQNQMDQILAYMYMMLERQKGKLIGQPAACCGRWARTCSSLTA